MKFTEQQVSIVGRSLSDSAALVCQVDKDDNWKFYGENYIEEAKTALAALSAAAPQVEADERAQNNSQAHTWPAEIWLQVGDCDNGAEMTYDAAMRHEVTWCAESIDRNDVQYVRAAAPVQANSKSEHPSLSVPIDPACSAKLDDLGDDRGQGLDSYWKSAFRAGWKYGQDAKDIAPVQPVAVPEALRLLAILFDNWENGTPCQESFDGVSIGNAFKLSDEDFHACVKVLEGTPRAAPAAQGDAKPESDVCKNFKRRAPFVSSMLDKKIYIGYEINSEGRFTSTAVESEFLAWESRAAIAAKAES